MTHNSIPMTRILSEDVGAFDLFAPGMGYKRAQARKTQKGAFAKLATVALSLFTAYKAFIDRVFA